MVPDVAPQRLAILFNSDTLRTIAEIFNSNFRGNNPRDPCTQFNTHCAPRIKDAQLTSGRTFVKTIIVFLPIFFIYWYIPSKYPDGNTSFNSIL